MYISCSSCVMADRDLAGALARMLELGFRHFDLFALENMGHVWPSRLAADGAGDLAKVIGDSGMKVSSVNCGFSVSVNDPDPSARGQLEKEHAAILDLAEDIGCPLLTFQTGGHSRQVGRVEAFDRALAGLEHLRNLAGDRSVRLTFEPHYGAVVEKPADALYMARRLWPDVGITYDPSHFVMQEDIESPAESEALLDYTTHVHVRNAAPGKMQTPMDEGVVDFAWLAEALRKRHYAGAVAIEYLEAAEAEAINLRDVLAGLGLTLS